jgi:cyclopropane-fatty-acyl-phospholipid synthase
MLPYATKKRFFKSWDTWLLGLAAKIFNFQSVSRASMIADAHYNLGNDFFAAWLDPNMQYTCAYWKDAETLEQAQLNKMHLVARKLKLEPGMHVLDLGCGWGTLACFMAKHYGVKVTGVNISSEQVKFARELASSMKLSDQVNFILDDYRKASGEFDRFQHYNPHLLFLHHYLIFVRMQRQLQAINRKLTTLCVHCVLAVKVIYEICCTFILSI